MPTYTYRCETCGHQFDIFQHFTDDALTDCPECGKQTLHKVYSPVGIVFKGSGFYSTDNRSPSGQTPFHHESSASEEGHHDTASDKKTDTAAKATETASAPKTDSKTDSAKA